MIRFGPAGSGARFTELGYKSSLQVPGYLETLGLNAFEYQCGRGVHIGEDKARGLGEKAREHGVALSLHAPYYISLSSPEKEKRDNSINYILQSARAVNAMGGTRIVVHSGALSKMTREEALSLALDTMKRALEALDAEGLSHIRPCPETMGKVNQLGTLQEVMEICKLDERLIPCIDFGHLNARGHGFFQSINDYDTVFRTIENELGASRLHEFHSHFSKIEYSAGGEKRHLTFEDTVYGPDYEPVMELTLRHGCEPTFICESAGTQDIDAAAMFSYYRSLRQGAGKDDVK